MIKWLRLHIKIILIYFIVLVGIVLFNIWLVSTCLKPKTVIKVREKVKIEEKIKEVDSNKYYLYEDRYQLISLIIYNDEFASFDTVLKNAGNDLPLSDVFTSHDWTVLYSIESYTNKYFFKDSYDYVMEVTKLKDGLLLRDYNFEPSTLQVICDKTNRFVKSIYD